MKIFYDVMDRRSVARLALAPASAHRLFAAALRGDLQRYAAQSGVTLYSVLLAGFRALLHRHTGQEQLELVVRLPRSEAQEKALVSWPPGSVLQLRSQLSPDTRLQKLCELGLDALVPAPALDPSVSHDLTAEIILQADTLVVQVEYNRDFFTAEQIERMLGHWEMLLRAVITDPAQPVETVPLLTPAEYTQIVNDWNATAVAGNSEVCVHQLFEQQASRTPHAIAAVFGTATLSYQELDRRANRLAETLQTLGVGPDCPVSIFMDRSLAMITVVLAVLKAGGAYVPLDPAYPRDRLEWICADTNAPVLIAQRALADRLPVSRSHVILIDDSWETWEQTQPAAARLTTAVRPAHLAYIIYTSGSTGRPKGICLPHRALTNLIHWHQRNLLGGVRTLQFASLNFDASFHELFAAWATGGTIYLITESLRRDVVALTHFIAEQAIAKVILPVVVLQQMAEHFGNARALFRSVLEVTTTGEQLQITGPIVRLFKQLPHCTLHNHYGPSETHVVTALTLPPDPDSWPAYPSIGRPIDNTQIYILDRLLHPVPCGVIGELYIGGVSLAREYLGRPDLTAERFITDPFSTAAAAHLYRTGDLARYRPDGTIDFLGRIDHQVKIRGFRIELGEIEATLGQFPAVLEAVVLAREDTPGDKQLVAYIVLQPGWESATTALREFLATRLPDFMIPAAFVVQQKLPLNANGKVDRKALPPPDRQRPELTQRFAAPRSEREMQLAAIFAEVLNLDAVGIDDDFFALGGDSLRAVKVLARIRQSLGAEVPFQALFSHPTIAALAQAVAPYVASGSRSQPIAVIPRTQRLPVSFAQERMWFLSHLAPDSPAYNCSYFYRLRGPLDRAALEASLHALVARHEALRTTFREVDGQLFQHIAAPHDLMIETLELRHLSPGEQESVVLHTLTTAARRPLDLVHGPLFRAGIYTLDAEDHVFWLILHHIITDGRSMEVLLSELATIYDALRSGRPFPLSPLTLHYADYAAWERQNLNEESLKEHITYWQEKLAGAPPLVELPTDYPRPATQSLRGSEVTFAFDRELTGTLKKLGAEHKMTLTMVVLAGFAALVHRYTGQDELVLGIPSLGRDRVETESLVGFFVNALPIRLTFHGAPSFSSLLEQVRTASLEALEHDTLPFERLVQELHVERDASYHPVIQLALAPQLQEERILRLGGLRSERLTTTSNQAMFDLTLFLWEEAGECAGAIEYSTDLFQRDRIERLVAQLHTLLANGTAQPESPVATLPILTTTERQQLVVQWNPPQVVEFDGLCLPELIFAQAAATPDAVAVCESGPDARTLTYAELERRANRLAHHLQSLGVIPECRVALCMDRSLESIIGFLAILKAGGAYVPLDPEYPRERLAFLFQDAAPAVLLTKQPLLALLPLGTVPYVCLDTESVEVAACGDQPPDVVISPRSLAYVIYTSGSTGKPKGVLIEHHSLARLAKAQRHAFAISSTTRLLQFSSLSFDASVSELATALTAGATLCLLPQGPPPVGLELGRLLQTQQITVVTLPPSVLRDLPFDLGAGVQTLVVAGEACAADLVARWAGGRRFINAYGPTECTVNATLAVCQPDSGPPPIGRPLPQARVYVLDGQKNPVPIGIPGELYIGGEGVARGYLNRPELTAERFLPDPFVGGTARCYRTGDRVRWRADGNLEFLGRYDHQIKLHGFRIELGEVESVLTEYAGVHDAIVLAREDHPGDKRLVAYVVSSEQAPPPLELWPSIAEYFVYDDLIYYALSSDELRNRVYRSAIARAVPGKIVLEIGTGAEAVLARMCVEEGARHVYAIEILEESYRKAKQRIAEAGMSDRITIIKGDATAVVLPEPAEVCVSEIVGAIGGSEAAAYIINEAWRLLTPGAQMIPGRSVTRIAALTLADDFLQAPAFTPLAAHYVEKIFAQVGYPFDLRLCLRKVPDGSVISDVGIFEDLDFRQLIPLETSHHTTLSITRDARLSGFLVWLNLYPDEQECIDILAQEHSWIPVFLPVFDTGIAVAAGTQLTMHIKRVLCENGRNPDYVMAGEVVFADGRRLPWQYTAYHIGGGYRQSPFYTRLFAGESGAAPPAAKNLAAPNALHERLRTFLSQRLPHYMLPSAFITLDALPLSPNGKVDRRALPAPSATATKRTSVSALPEGPAELLIAAIWQELLHVERVGRHDNFFTLGGYSLLVAKVILRIQDALGVEIPIRALYETPTVAGLADLVRRNGRAAPESLCFDPSLELAQEAVLPDDITAVGLDPTTPAAARHVFLTGATGYVGIFLLAELLSDPAADVTVHCLMRGRSVDEAAARLQQKLALYGLESAAWAPRIRYVLGDLEAPYLGLDPTAFDELAATIDVIYHSGAKVDHVRGYAVMKPSNVLGTQEILRLACRRRLKTVHHLSTLGVLYPPSYTGAAVAYEADVAGPLELLPNGYMQSKCVAEHLVTTALARGIPAVIYRLGAITGHSKTGVCNLDDYFYGALRTAVKLATSDPLNTDLTVTPVDFATRAIVAISRRPDARGRTFHVTHPEPLWWLDLMQWLRSYGYAITTRPYEECMARLYAAARGGIEVPMHAFLPLLVQKRADSTHYVMEDYYVQVRYDCQNLLDALGAEVRLLPSPKPLLAVYIEYLRQHHLLAAPYAAPDTGRDPERDPELVAERWSTI